MANIFKISQALPLKWYPLSDIWNSQETTTDAALYSFNTHYNTRHFDADFWERNLESWMEKATYFKPYQKNDNIREQFLGIEETLSVQYILRLCTPCGKEVKQVNCTFGDEVGTTGEYIWEYDMPLYDVEEGKYICQLWHIPATSLESHVFMVSNPIEVKAYHEGSELMKYKHSSNDQDIFFETGIILTSRYFAHITDFNPTSTRNVYSDEPKNLTLLSGITAREWQINFKSLPDYEIDKLSRQFDCDTVIIDGTQYTATEGGKMEIEPVKNSPLKNIKIQVQESNNIVTKVVSSFPEIIFCDAPNTRRFYVDSYTFPAIPVTNPIEKHFEGVNQFLGYLNNTLLKGFPEDTYFTVNARNQIVLITANSTYYALYEGGTFNDILPYWISMDMNIDAALEFDASSASSFDYSFDNGDGVMALGSGTSTTQAESYTNNLTAYFFMSDCESLDFGSTTYQSIKSIDGDLPTSLEFLSLSSQQIEGVKNDMFTHCVGGLQYIYLGANALDSNTINRLIMNLYDAKKRGGFNATATVELDSQLPSGSPPMFEDSGIASMINYIKANGITLSTD